MSAPKTSSTSDEPVIGSPDRGEGKTILAPAYESRRRLPVNFPEHDRQLFEHELTKHIPETRLLELHDVHASSDGILFKAGRILPESFAFPFLFDDWTRGAKAKFLARNYLIRKQRRLQRGLWIVDNWSDGYFHWLADALSRLFMARGQLDSLTLILPQHYARLGFVQASLNAFAVPNVEFIDEDESLLIDKLVIPNHAAPSGHFREEVIRGVRDLLVERYGGSAKSFGDRLYISRGRAPKRKIANEEEVQAVLREFGFHVIYAEDHSFEEQVAMAAQARNLVSNHGAGLTNMLFMPPGNNVSELRHETDRVNNCYFVLASALDLNYYYQTCPPENPSEDPHGADLRVDIEALRRNIELMLGS